MIRWIARRGEVGATMRVLFWSERFWPIIGGVSVSAAKLLPALRERGCEFVVVTSGDEFNLPDETQYKGIPVHRFPFWSAVALRDLSQLRAVRQRVTKLKRAFKPDLVHINFLGPSVLFHFSTAHAHPAPLLVTLDSGFPGAAAYDTLVGQTLRAADWVTSVSAARLAEARQLVLEIVPYSSVVYNGREVPPLLPAPLPFAAPRVLCLGRLVPDKGFDLAVAAFAPLVRRFPRARLVIAGDGPARPDLEQQAVALGLTEVIDFLGWVDPDAVPALMNSVTLVVMPSRHEGFGGVALEAALMARPVVATRVGGLPEAVVHDATGLLIDPENSPALTEAIGHLLDQPDTATRLGHAARRRAQDVFGWERYVDAHDALYQRLVKEGGRR